MTIKLREIPGFPSDKYAAGSDGHIYSRARKFKNRKRIKGGWYRLAESHRGPYPGISFRLNGKVIWSSVHRLVIRAFHGERPQNKTEVRHLDGEPDNNRPENLCWGTVKENAADRVLHGTQTYGEDHPGSKLSDKQRDQMKTMWTQGMRQREIAEVFGVAKSLVRYTLGRHHCLHRPYKKHWARKLSKHDMETMNRMKDDGFNRDEIAEMFDVHPVHVSRVVKVIKKGKSNGQ